MPDKPPHLPDRIERLPLQDLTPYARNSRTHSPAQVAQIAASIREFGFTNPILIDENGTIIAGHGRALAAERAGLTHAPCIRLSHLNEAQRRAYVIADNKLAENAGWDMAALARELEDLAALDFDLPIIGFDDSELAELLGADLPQPGSREADEDITPAVDAGGVTNPGDVWLMAGHRLMCGDATCPDAVSSLCGGPVDMWLTDPPYNVDYEGRTSDALTIENDAMSDADFRSFLVAAYSAADASLRPGGVFYIWHSSAETMNFMGAARDVGWPVRQVLVWSKSTMVFGRSDYHWRHEPCLYGWKPGAAHLWTGDRRQTTVLEFDRPAQNTEHPTMKPVALFEYLMLNNTVSGDVVLDSFGGSGTTLIAAEKHRRRARIMELSPRYCDVIVRRWERYTGQRATLEADGRTFGQIMDERAGALSGA